MNSVQWCGPELGKCEWLHCGVSMDQIGSEMREMQLLLLVFS